MKNLAIRPLKTVGVTMATGLMTALPLMAQDDKPNTNALHSYLLDGGPLTIIIVAVGLLSLIGLTVYNFINLTKAKFCPDDLKAALLDHMVNCRVRSAIELSASHPSYLGRMLAYALPNIDATQPEDLGRDHVEDAIADFSINENRKQMTWINLISLVAQSAPMMGLFGTVFGMIAAFGTLKTSGSADPTALAGDISVALLTTMWGLVVAIFAVIAYFFFKGRYNALVAECHQSAEELLNASVQTVNGEAHLAKIPEGIAV
ncbi:biopolymer transport protein ExbB [Rubritalea squalenifaciens DSM 18772]|uniref:Biopolymer transport protein ExbB n=2 Tax=Rubritalea TaxID=361050 RepID=A0A1M6DKA8_9BACT|nr:MotA/TolQ/ExbB proton channel family protein [Rubritalea squalenifaciens]SHI73754.1 biopolymer transport protein ExbB [Rubritalea squalenifaciens DSM 18772]